MTDPVLTRRDFIALGSACVVLASAQSAVATSLPRTSLPRTLQFGLVQSALWPVHPRHAAADLLRNAERMAETIRAVGPRCSWLAFHDRALSGGTTAVDLSHGGSLPRIQADSLIDVIAEAAKSAGCWVSFGMPSIAASLNPAVAGQEIATAISAQGTCLQGPWIRSELGLLGLSVGQPSASMLARARREGALALILMNAGPVTNAGSDRRSAASLRGIALLEVHAAHTDLRMACPTRWLGGSGARDAQGAVIGKCLGADEETLLASLPVPEQSTES